VRKINRLHRLQCIGLFLSFFIKDIFGKDKSKQQGFTCISCGIRYPLFRSKSWFKIRYWNHTAKWNLANQIIGR